MNSILLLSKQAQSIFDSVNLREISRIHFANECVANAMLPLSHLAFLVFSSIFTNGSVAAVQPSSTKIIVRPRPQSRSPTALIV